MKLPKPKPQRFFTKDPEILWKKIFCPMCGEPTGSKSKCYENPPEDIPPSRRKLVHKKMGILPIYSKSCIYRQENGWEAHFNYPVSNVLIKKLKAIEGVQRIVAIQPYSAHIVIGTLFDEAETKQRINITFKTFIKELQSIESHLYGTGELIKSNRLYDGILLPNGKELKLSHSASQEEAERQHAIIENLLENLPDTKGILNESVEKKSDQEYTKAKENEHENNF